MITKEGAAIPSIVPGSNVTSNITVELVKKGFMYTCQDVIEDIAVGDVVDIYFDPTLFDGKFLVIYDIEYSVTQGKGVGQFFGGGDYTEDGALLACVNRNENSGNTAKTRFTLAPIVTTLGTAGLKYIAGSEAQGVFLGGGGGGDTDFPTEVKKEIDRIFRITQSGGTGTFDLQLRVVFAEIL